MPAMFSVVHDVLGAVVLDVLVVHGVLVVLEELDPLPKPFPEVAKRLVRQERF